MSLSDEIGAVVDGKPIAHQSVQVVCDLPHSVPKAVDLDDRVQYEFCRIDEAVTIYDRMGIPCYDVWIPDLLRCDDCELESVPQPTQDYDEALVELDIRWDDDHYVLDGSDVTVIDYSPRDDGFEPSGTPLPVVKTMVDENDPGMLRRSRLARSIPYLRNRGAEDLAAQLETILDV